jgi:hypothetical protein
LTPWAAASTAPAVGSRKCERVHGGWQGAFRATKDRVSSFLPYPLRCTRFSATARPRRRGPVKHGGVVLRERKRLRLNLASPRSTRARAGVHGNADVGLVKQRVRAQVRTRTRPARCGVVDSIGITRRTRRHREARLRKRRALTKAAAPARSCIAAWHEGRHHQRRRGGAVRSTPARWPWYPQEGSSGCPHLCGSWPKCSASV